MIISKSVKLLLVAVTIFTSNCYSQESYLLSQMSMVDGKVFYERIITIDSVDKATLYQKSKSWALSNFKSQKDALQIDDKDAGVIAYKTFSSFSYQIEVDKFLFNEKYDINYLIKFFLKEGKAKIIIQDVTVNSISGGIENPNLPIEQFANWYEHPNDSLYSNLKMSKKQKEKTKDTFKKQKVIVISMLHSMNTDFINILDSIQNQLIGKTKSEMDF
jgi:hypothetical protein